MASELFKQLSSSVYCSGRQATRYSVCLGVEE
jgi:hypothetical protein